MANYKKWTNSETDFINHNHKQLNDQTLAEKLSQMTGQSITTAMVRRQRRKLKLSKPRGRPSKVITSTVEVVGETIQN
jgi:hypothetical protein